MAASIIDRVELIRRALTPYVLARNALDYPLRRLIRLERPIRAVEPAGLAAALAGLDGRDAARAGGLIERYRLGPLVARGRRRDVLENLYYLELIAAGLERAGATLPERVEAVDVGASDWFYAPALTAALRWWRTERAREVALWGLETDPGQRYADGHTRADWARWHTAGLTGATYVTGDGRRWEQPVDAATMLFPFVFSRDSDDWGLPRTLFRPEQLLARTWACLRPGGVLLVANQGERERDEQRRLFERAGIEAATERFESAFWRYELTRYLHVARK
jgi:hypothetical protein